MKKIILLLHLMFFFHYQPLFCAVDFTSSYIGSIGTPSLGGTNEQTIYAFIEPDNAGGYNVGGIIERWYGKGQFFYVDANGAIVYSSSYVGGSKARVTNNSTITFGNKYKIIVTDDNSANGAGIHIYVNGIEASYQATTDGVGNQHGDNVVEIGRRTASGGREFNGRIFECAMFNSVLTSDEIQILGSNLKYNPLMIDSVIAYWSLDDLPSGTIINNQTFMDLSGNGYDGTGVGNATSVPETVLSYPAMAMFWTTSVASTPPVASSFLSNALYRGIGRGISRGLR